MTERDLTDSTVDLPTLASAEALAVVPGYMLIRMRDETAVSRAYECRSEKSGEFVLVHVLQKDFAADSARKNRALRDSRLVMALRGQNHVGRVLDVGEGAAGAWIVVELAAAGVLSTRIEERGRMPVVDALIAVRDAARGLDAAHQAGVLHRDITPRRLNDGGDGTYKLAGFGLAEPLVGDGVPEGRLGSPEVLAPEVIHGAAADARSDIYALGATLFWLITGRPIFSGTPAEILAAHQKKPVPSIASLVPDAGIAVVDILYRLLQKDPARRPQTAGEVATLLDAAISRMQRDSALPAPAATGSEPPWPTMQSSTQAGTPSSMQSGLPRTSSSSTIPGRAPPTRAPAPAGGGPSAAAGRTELPSMPPTGSSPFDAASTDGDPYVGQPTGVMGSLKQMSVIEILQTLEIGKKSARVDVHAIDGDKGTFHVHDGQIVHASSPTGAGESVVGHLMRKKEGFFRIHYEKEPCEKNITRPTTFVLLEAMRVLDEASALNPAPAAAPNAAPRPAPSPAPSPAPNTATVDLKPPARPALKAEAPARTKTPPPVNAVVVKRPADKVPLARPMAHAQDAPTPAPQVGDGIDETDDGTEALDRGSRVDDVTVPQVPTQGVRVRAAAATAARQARTLAVQTATVVRTQTPLLLAAAEERFAPVRVRLAHKAPRVASLPLWQLGVGVAVLGVCCVIVLRAFVGGGDAPVSYDDAVEHVLEGDAADVVASLDAVGAHERSAWQDLALGHAHMALGDAERALSLYQEALGGGAVDAHELATLMARLDTERPDSEVDLLVLWPDAEAEDALALAAVGPSYSLRENAIAALVERGALGRIAVEDSARLDLLGAPGCTQRRAALVTLREAGRTESTRAAIELAGRLESNGCFRGDLALTYGAVVQRIKEQLRQP